MSYYVPMSKVLFPVDGPHNKSIRRLFPLLNIQAMKSMTEALGDVVFWYDSKHFHATPTESAVYFPAYEQMLGTTSTRSLLSSLPPHGQQAIPELLIESYILTQMGQMGNYDVVLFCVAGTKYKAPSNRTLIHKASDVAKGTCLIGSFATVESRTDVIEATSQLSLSCLVVRALRMDTGDEDYEWEREYRVACIHI